MSIEESFSSRFLLESSAGSMRQYGYDFFNIPTSQLPPNDMPVGPDYVLGPDDVLVLHIWNMPEAATGAFKLQIGRDGTAYLPQVGPIPLAGVTFGEATRIVDTHLRRLYKRFQMHLTIQHLRLIKVYVVGEINRPGPYDLSSLSTVMVALAAACGPAKSGSLRKVHLIRDSKPVALIDFYRFFQEGDRSQDMRLRSGDTIVVPPIGDVAAIAGPVRGPGIFEFKAPMRLGGLIRQAGGLNPSANRTRAQIFRMIPGREREILDLNVDLNAIVQGKAGVQDPAIMNGDFVRLSAVNTVLDNTVGIGGMVRNPGPVAFRPGMRLGDLVTRDQILADAFLERAELVRTDPLTYRNRVISFSPRKLLAGDRGENIILQRLDKVVIQSQARGSEMVTLVGEVVRPGGYVKEPAERISSVLKRAGGFTEQAFPQGIILVRASAQAAQRTELAKFVSLQRQRLLSEAAALSSGAASVQVGGQGQLGVTQEQLALESQLAALNELALRSANGRVIIHAETLAKLEGSTDDLVLEPGDVLTVPIRPQTVSVFGGVRNPAIFTFRPGLSAKDYLRMAGGFTKYAHEDEGYLVRANGATDLSLKSNMSVGDTIIIPERIDPEVRTLPTLTALAAIFASLATATLAIVLIDRSTSR
jgi:protein involved in polysaccharide export with SLBB domain